VDAAVRSEEHRVLQRHAEKWRDLTDSDYPCAPYHFAYQFCFPFQQVDGYWFDGRGERRCRQPESLAIDSFSNETAVSVPTDVATLLSKGPRFRIPPKLNEKFQDQLALNLEVFSRNLRWNQVNMKATPQTIHVPFQRNTVSMPPRMTPEREEQLCLLKNEIKRMTENEIERLKKAPYFKEMKKKIWKAKAFLDENNLTTIPSDKTNRLVITDKENLDKRILSILGDETTYLPLAKSKQTQIEKQANQILKHIVKDKHSKSVKDKLLSTGSRPATFQVFCKDHKSNSGLGYPLRPIASVRNTAAEKTDWLVSTILVNLVSLVPANVRNAADIIDHLNLINKDAITANHVFISLDVVSLYPSIPLDFGIECVLDFAKLNWDKIDNKGLTIDQLKKALTFVCYNYEIQFKEKIYKQIKGCPMGAHFAPPFAIITMHYIESAALNILKDKFKFSPILYKRYIDDILLGPLPKSDFTDTILETFNSVNTNIQFTLEAPKPGEPIPFLDLSIYVKDKNIEYSWHVKPNHSNNSLRIDSWIPNSVKTNYIRNSIQTVTNRCSNKTLEAAAMHRLSTRFAKNGFHKVPVFTRPKKNKNKKAEQNGNNNIFLKLDFVNDRLSRKIRNIVKKYDFPIQLINKPSKNLNQMLNTHKNRNVSKHENCSTCDHLPVDFSCVDRFLVYKFQCQLCNQLYIGETSRPFHYRYKEHMRSLNIKDKKSALSQHALDIHKQANLTIADFSLSILYKCRSPVETRLTEARAISIYGPNINRKNERW
jgi:hypothetical protein